MSKLLSKITIASITIAATAAGTIYLTSFSGDNSIVSKSNIAIANENGSKATLVSVSVWDKETESNYSGKTEMTVYRSPNCGCCGVW
ncbi:MAG: DUF411 domain-containing protein, partial [Cyanobacteria bacterium J06553_1]